MQQLNVIRTQEQLDDLLTYIQGKKYIAWDTETTGVDQESEIIGISISAEPDIGFYVVLKEWDTASHALISLETAPSAKNFCLALEGKKLIAHNALFDCSMVLRNYGVDLMPSIHTDTLQLAFLLDENRPCGLKELGTVLFGEDATKEQVEMKESVKRNGGELTKANYELYKADSELIARYGAKDAVLTLALFYHLVEDLYAQGLEKFFYEEESMPLLRGPTYDLNLTGLRIDNEKLQHLKQTLEAECLELKAYVYKEITPIVQAEYPGTGKTNAFNIGSTKQLAWLLFGKLGNNFHLLTDEGKDLCKAFGLRLPYAFRDKRAFIDTCTASEGRTWKPGGVNPKTGKKTRAKVVKKPWDYMACGKEALDKFVTKYKWVEKLQQYNTNLKILNTYVTGIQERMSYNVIRPSFLQHGTTSGRYSSRNPNFQNLPRKDKRIKACIISRPGKVFVGADYSQLEPRVFASQSGDARLLESFQKGEDFYSVVGSEVYEKYDCSLLKEEEGSFAKKYPSLRDDSKVIALASVYGATAPRLAPLMGKSMDDAQAVIDAYFEKFPKVAEFMLQRHNEVKRTGQVKNLFGRPRRLPAAVEIPKVFGAKTRHAELPSQARTLLNLAVNHTVQSTGASIVNRSAIALREDMKTCGISAKIVLQVHDSLIVECDESDAPLVSELMQNAMENTVKLPGVDLIAKPLIGGNLAEV